MAKQTIDKIKSWFKTGLKPTQPQFWDWLDSFWHKDDKIPVGSIDGLQKALDNMPDASVISGLNDLLQEHVKDTENPHNVTKNQLGLDNVDNTSDANKPISNATASALQAVNNAVNAVDAKANTKLTQGGDALNAPVVLGSKNAQNVIVNVNDTEQARFTPTGFKVTTPVVAGANGGIEVLPSNAQRPGATQLNVNNTALIAYDNTFHFLEPGSSVLQVSLAGVFGGLSTKRAFMVSGSPNPSGLNNSYLLLRVSNMNEFNDQGSYPNGQNYYELATRLNGPRTASDGNLGVRAPLYISGNEIGFYTGQQNANACGSVTVCIKKDGVVQITNLQGVGNRVIYVDSSGNLCASNVDPTQDLDCVDDSAGLLTSSQLSTKFPAAQIGQRTYGVANLYIKKSSTKWVAIPITNV